MHQGAKDKKGAWSANSQEAAEGFPGTLWLRCHGLLWQGRQHSGTRGLVIQPTWLYYTTVRVQRGPNLTLPGGQISAVCEDELSLEQLPLVICCLKKQCPHLVDHVFKHGILFAVQYSVYSHTLRVALAYNWKLVDHWRWNAYIGGDQRRLDTL